MIWASQTIILIMLGLLALLWAWISYLIAIDARARFFPSLMAWALLTFIVGAVALSLIYFYNVIGA